MDGKAGADPVAAAADDPRSIGHVKLVELDTQATVTVAGPAPGVTIDSQAARQIRDVTDQDFRNAFFQRFGPEMVIGRDDFILPDLHREAATVQVIGEHDRANDQVWIRLAGFDRRNHVISR